METKVCTRCGIERPIGHFRQYYNRSKGTYTFCKTCESIEGRRKYLVGKDAASLDGLSAEEQYELDKINELYEQHRAAGRPVPGSRKSPKGVTSVVEAMLSK